MTDEVRFISSCSVPAGALIIAIVLWVFPKNPTPLRINCQSFGRIDWPGSILSLAGSVLLIFALEEGGTVYAWNSAAIIVSFAVQGVCWGLFALWEAVLSSRNSMSSMLPIFPARLVSHRIIASAVVYEP